MVKKTIFLIGLCLLICLRMHAQIVSMETAQRVAENFFNIESSSDSQVSLQVRTFGDREQATLYAFSLSNRWVVIAGDKRVQPILAYSDDEGEAFPSDSDMPPAMSELLDWYNVQIADLHSDRTITKDHPQWGIYLDPNNNSVIHNRSVIVAPLLVRDGHQNIWKQSGNNNGNNVTKCYNKFCPSAWNPNTLDSCTHSKVGCVAVATSQVMWYWQWPHAAILNQYFPQLTAVRYYDWDLMPYRLTNASIIEEADMIATLLHDVGVEVGMNYGCSGSGANPEHISAALRNTYEYHAGDLEHRSNIPNSDWIGRIKAELNNLRPVIYGGFRDSVGHQFVLDGYNSINQFHINFGWGNGYNGYFSLDTIYNNYNNNQSMVRNIYPDYPSCNLLHISPLYELPNTFVIENGGGIIIDSGAILGQKVGVIVSGEFVLLKKGFQASSSHVHMRITVSEMPCNANREITLDSDIEDYHAPSKLKTLTDVPPSATKILSDGQLLIILGDKIYTATGQEVK